MSVSDRNCESSSQRGDLVDVEGLYRRYAESVYRRCLRLTRDQTRALDLTQEAFLRAHRYRHSYRGEATPLSWLFAIADRCFLTSLRKVEPLAVEEIGDFLVQEEGEGEEVFQQHELVTKLLSRAPKDVRQIVIHRYFDELEHQQIADRLGINEKTVRRKLQRFLKSARKFVRRS